MSRNKPNPNDPLEVDNNHLKKMEKKIIRKLDNKFRNITPYLHRIIKHYPLDELKYEYRNRPNHLFWFNQLSMPDNLIQLTAANARLLKKLKHNVTPDNYKLLQNALGDKSITPLDNAVINFKLTMLIENKKRPFKVFTKGK